VADDPHPRESANVLQDAVDLRRDERTAAEVAVDGDVEIGRRLVGVEVVERVLVDVIPITRVAAQHAVVGEIGMRKRDDRARSNVHAKRQIDVVVIAVPEKALFGDDRLGVIG
jgi:hypothetical protein